MNSARLKLLFIHPGGLGDVILLSPSLKALRAEYAYTLRIDLLVEERAFDGAAEFLFATEWIDELHCHDFKGRQTLRGLSRLMTIVRGGYDIVLSSGSSPMVALLLALTGAARRIGFASSISRFLLTSSVELRRQDYASKMLFELVRPLLSKTLEHSHVPNWYPKERLIKPERDYGQPYWLIHPGCSKLAASKGIFKSPSGAYWRELIWQMCSEMPSKRIVLVGGADDAALIDNIVSTGAVMHSNFVNETVNSFDLLQLANLIHFAEGFICVDSAPMHLAVALNHRNTIALFGPTDPGKLLPCPTDIKPVKVSEMICSPCLWQLRSRCCHLPLCNMLQDPSEVIRLVRESQLYGSANRE